jgi:hypothetical protein
MGVQKPRAEHGDNPDVEGKVLPNLEHANIPKAGDSSHK